MVCVDLDLVVRVELRGWFGFWNALSDVFFLPLLVCVLSKDCNEEFAFSQAILECVGSSSQIVRNLRRQRRRVSFTWFVDFSRFLSVYPCLLLSTVVGFRFSVLSSQLVWCQWWPENCRNSFKFFHVICLVNFYNRSDVFI